MKWEITFYIIVKLITVIKSYHNYYKSLFSGFFDMINESILSQFGFYTLTGSKSSLQRKCSHHRTYHWVLLPK